MGLAAKTKVSILYIYLLWFIVQNMQHGSPKAKLYITNKNIECKDGLKKFKLKRIHTHNIVIIDCQTCI